LLRVTPNCHAWLLTSRKRCRSAIIIKPVFWGPEIPRKSATSLLVVPLPDVGSIPNIRMSIARRKLPSPERTDPCWPGSADMEEVVVNPLGSRARRGA
jgi:hypothetical protein